MRRTIVVPLALTLMLSAVCLAASDAAPLAEIARRFGPPVLHVPRPSVAPRIDGRLDDDAWSKAQPVTLSFLVDGWDTPSQKTEARVLADEKAIYFGVQCFEAHPEQMLAAGEKRDGDLWNGDTVEFFLDPGHREKRGEYYHIIINPKGLLYDARGKDPKAWDAQIEAKVGTFEGGWTVEAAVPMKDLGFAAPVEIPGIWGLNITRQRPQLGVLKPRGAALVPQQIRLDEPQKYRDGEDSAWAPTYCESSHVVQRFGHAVLEAGARDVAPPQHLFEVIYRSDFNDGDVGAFQDAVIRDDNFRGPGECISPKEGKGAVFLRKALVDLDDATMILALQMPANGRLYYYGRAPDDEQCEADRHEIFMTKEEAAARKFPGLDLYDTHADRMAWMPQGRLWNAPGSWAMMTGHFAEPSIGSVISPGKDWVILRTRLGQFRRQGSQALVPPSQNYPQGLVFAAGEPYLIDDIVIFRGADVEPPEQPGVANIKREGDEVVVSWQQAKDNTLAAYYQVYLGETLAAETHRLSIRLKAASAEGRPITVVARDLYGNASRPVEAKTAP